MDITYTACVCADYLSVEFMNILLVAKLGYRRQSILSILNSLSEFHVTVTDSISQALEIHKTLHPEIILIDSDIITPETENSKIFFKCNGKQTRCYILVDNENPYQVSRCVNANGVISKNLSASAFVKTLNDIINN